MGLFGKAEKTAYKKFSDKLSKRFGATLGKQAMSGIKEGTFEKVTKNAKAMWEKNLRVYENDAPTRMNYKQDQNIPFYNSSAIERVVYQPDTKIAYIAFTSDKDKYYAYPNIDKSKMTGWTKAASKGKYFWHSGIQTKAQPNFRSKIDPNKASTTMYKQYGSFGYYKPPHSTKDAGGENKTSWFWGGR